MSEHDDDLDKPLEEEERPRWGGTRAKRPPGANGSMVRAVPGLARIYVSAWWRFSEWTAATAGRAGSRVLRAARTGESPAELFQAAGAYSREYARRALGLVEELPGMGDSRDGDNGAEEGEDNSALRNRGSELLRRSADVNFDEDMHPAYAGILEQLAPDEARILRLLAEDGPQVSVDVRTARPLGIGSHLISSGLNMIGAEAGCRHTDRVHSYLNNLFRLGLIWFSREPVREPLRYQVLEAQPEVIDALRKAGRGSTVRRSVELTSFGEDFCSFCLPLEDAEFE